MVSESTSMLGQYNISVTNGDLFIGELITLIQNFSCGEPIRADVAIERRDDFAQCQWRDRTRSLDNSQDLILQLLDCTLGDWIPILVLDSAQVEMNYILCEKLIANKRLEARCIASSNNSGWPIQWDYIVDEGNEG
jgi:hypothetical protein